MTVDDLDFIVQRLKEEGLGDNQILADVRFGAILTDARDTAFGPVIWGGREIVQIHAGPLMFPNAIPPTLEPTADLDEGELEEIEYLRKTAGLAIVS